MRKVIIFAAVVLFFSSCKIYSPVYRRTENFKYESLGMSGFKFGTDVVFHNPNSFGFRISKMDLKIVVDQKNIAYFNQNEQIKIKRKSDFSIPLKVTVKPDMSLIDALKKVGEIVGQRKIDLTLGGSIQVKWFVFKKNLPMNMKETIKF